MRLLMHICCANCALFPLKALMEGGHGITGLWFNPNIHPEDEYERRLGAVRGLADMRGLEVLYRGGHGQEEFHRALEARGAGRERPGRCGACYRMRMRETARECALGEYDAFTTSLLASPYQAHALLMSEAGAAAVEFGVRFYYEDFRPGWREGQSLSREAGFYRQYYCGCRYSKDERDIERALRGRSRAAR
jgi:predicted adenine nucleotide alpha hydrolase (AANH) superfamily ATPase